MGGRAVVATMILLAACSGSGDSVAERARTTTDCEELNSILTEKVFTGDPDDRLSQDQQKIFDNALARLQTLGCEGEAKAAAAGDQSAAGIAFAKALAAQAPSLNAGRHAELVGLGHSICDRLRRGASLTEVTSTLMASFSSQEATALASAAVSSFCPEFATGARR